ncbi:MAG: hypothetical protein IJ730_00300, partial [Alphaproteobacteria bacterium]|nr:hypothetical protein [Alphaproteobacteria bacterium]
MRHFCRAVVTKLTMWGRVNFCQKCIRWINESRRHLRNKLRSNETSEAKTFVLNRKSFGGILIEFAISLPLLLVLLFFVNDHYRLHELKNKCRGSAY